MVKGEGLYLDQSIGEPNYVGLGYKDVEVISSGQNASGECQNVSARCSRSPGKGFEVPLVQRDSTTPGNSEAEMSQNQSYIGIQMSC